MLDGITLSFISAGHKKETCHLPAILVQKCHRASSNLQSSSDPAVSMRSGGAIELPQMRYGQGIHIAKDL
jgi:hypothetical protein